MAKSKCTHKFVSHVWSEPVNQSVHALAAFCAQPRCGVRLPLGESNDADVPADEIIAAVCAHSDADHAAFEENGVYSWDPARPLAEQWPWNGRSALEQVLYAVDAAEEHVALTGPTDQGQPVETMAGPVSADDLYCDPLTDAEVATIIAQSSDSFEPRRVTSRLPYDPELDRKAALERLSPTPRDPDENRFAPEDSASAEPWLDPGTSTQMTDSELVETVAYCPPGSVSDPKVALALGLLGMSDPSSPDHAKLCEQLCEMFPSAERKP